MFRAKSLDEIVADSRSQDRTFGMRPHTRLPKDLAGERILSFKQGAELFGVSVATFRRLYEAGKLGPAIRTSERRLGLRAKDLLDYLAKRTGATA